MVSGMVTNTFAKIFLQISLSHDQTCILSSFYIDFLSILLIKITSISINIGYSEMLDYVAISENFQFPFQSFSSLHKTLTLASIRNFGQYDVQTTIKCYDLRFLYIKKVIVNKITISDRDASSHKSSIFLTCVYMYI